MTTVGSKYQIDLPIKENIHIRVDPEIFREAIVSLRDAVITLQLSSLRLSKTERIDDESWGNIMDLLKENFADTQVNIVICKNSVIIPEAGIRGTLIREIHESPINGHKGVAKTYKRMR